MLKQQDAGAGWSDVTVTLPWLLYQRFGDRRCLERHYPMMKRWIDYQCRTSIDGTRGAEDGPAAPGHGDWLAPDGDGLQPGRTGTPRSLIGTAYHAHSLNVFRQIALTLGHRSDADDAQQARHRAIHAFRRQYVRDGHLTVASQTAHLMALAFDLLPNAQRQAVFSDLLDLLADRNHHLSTGFLGTPLWCDVLTRFGRTDLAYDLLLTETYPGWLYPVTLGATTMWERWNSWHPDTGFVDLSMNSLNHYAYGAVGDWMYRTIAGVRLNLIDPDAPSLTLNPRPDPRLGHCSASLDSPVGRIESRWRYTDLKIEFELTVPIEATLRIESVTENRIGPGSHRFTVDRSDAIFSSTP